MKNVIRVVSVLYSNLTFEVLSVEETMSSVKVFTFLIFLNCVNGNKYCAFEQDGEAKYYVCQMRNEYCCRLGCCVNLAFQFYQMWYYWLLLIFMFMLCSGGGWWYRFCRQPSPSPYTMTNGASQHASERQSYRRSTLEQNHRRQRLVQAMQQNRVSMNDPAMNLLWKNAANSQPPPNYYSSSNSFYNANNSQSTLNYHSSVQQLCPYYQLYGPPPSYESVVQITNSCGSVQPTCVLVTTTPVPRSFPAANISTLPSNDVPSNSQLASVTNQSTISTALTEANTQFDDFAQPSTSSNIINNTLSIDRKFIRSKSGSSSV